MADMNPKSRAIEEFEKRGKMVAGTRLRIVVDNNVVYDKRVPAGKIARFWLRFRAIITNAL